MTDPADVPDYAAPHGRCPGCNAPLPNPWTDKCRHRRGCEARQMLQAGASSADAAAHAQNLRHARDKRGSVDHDGSASAGPLCVA
jgi:hypothetical protein